MTIQPPGMPPMGGYPTRQPASQANTAPQRADLSWTHQEDGAAVSSTLIAQTEQRFAEARERGFWPRRYRLRPDPGATGNENMGQVIILDTKPGPRYWEHMMRNPKTGYYDTPEPCPKEFESCPLCASGDESSWVMLLTVLNLHGYVKRDGTHVHPTKELMVVKLRQHPVFDRLHQNYGTLRGLQLTLVRNGPKTPAIGEIDPASPIQQHTDEDIEAYLKQLGKWTPLTSKKDGRVLEPENWMSVPYDYARFLHKPSAERLRRLYGGAAPVGASDYNGGYNQPQWGGGAPGVATMPAPAPAPAPRTTAVNPGIDPGPTTIGSTTVQTPAPAPAPGITPSIEPRERPRPAQPDQVAQPPQGQPAPSGDLGWAQHNPGSGPGGAPTGPADDLDDEIPFE